MEGRALEILWDWGGVARPQTLARELRISIEYARLIANRLEEQEYVQIRNGWYELRGKGRIEAAKRKTGKPTKIVVSPPLDIVRTDAKKSIVLGY